MRWSTGTWCDARLQAKPGDPRWCPQEQTPLSRGPEPASRPPGERGSPLVVSGAWAPTERAVGVLEPLLRLCSARRAWVSLPARALASEAWV